MIESCKILTWNCNGALRKKFQLLENFDADLTIIQECEDPAQTKDKKYRAWGENHLWVGENKNKGLGIFAKPSIKIHDNHWETNGTKFFISSGSIRKKGYLLVVHKMESKTINFVIQIVKH